MYLASYIQNNCTSTFGEPSRKKVRKEYQHYMDVLDKDGILVIPDFFTPGQFEEIKNEYEQIYSGWSPYEYKPEEHTKRQKRFSGNILKTVAEKITHPNTPAYMKYFVNNELINELTSAIVHRKVSFDSASPFLVFAKKVP
jgi:hypothetical protein